MEKIQPSNIVFIVIISLIIIIYINTFGSLNPPESQIKKLVSNTKTTYFEETVKTFLKGINCPIKLRFNGLSWECGQKDIAMDILITDNSGVVLMKDYITLDQKNLEASKDKRSQSLIEPHQFKGAYILLTSSNPLTTQNSQFSLEDINNNLRQDSELTKLIQSTPKIKDLLTLTTFNKDLTLTADIKNGFNPLNISQLNPWEYAQADWEGIVNQSFEYMYYDTSGLKCNQRYIKLQAHPAVNLLCNEIIATE